jgi:quinol monooxygenase YgiN
VPGKWKGTSGSNVYRDPKESNTFVLIEEYIDNAAFEAQQKSEHAQPCISMFPVWIASPPEVRFLKAENINKK